MNDWLSDLLKFDAMVTPKLITLIYYVLLVGVLLTSLSCLYSYGFLVGLPTGLLMLVVGGLMVRVWCELCIVLFKINEALQDIRKR